MRTTYCGLVSETLMDQTVTLMGWAHRRRDHGGVIFIDLRDREGLVQIVCDPYRTDRVLATLDTPVLILHARADTVVPISHGRALATLAAHATLVELDGDHNSGISLTREYWDAVERAVDGAFRGTDQPDR